MGWYPSDQIIVIPGGATTGERIVIDGINGTITMYNAADQITGQWSAPGQSLAIFGTDGSYAKLQSAAGHADLTLQPPDQVGDTWSPGDISGQIGDPAGIYPTNASLSLTSTDDSGTTAGPSKIVLVGPQSASDLNAIELASGNILLFGPDGSGASFPTQGVIDLSAATVSVHGNFSVSRGIGEIQDAEQSVDQTNATTNFADTELSFQVYGPASTGVPAPMYKFEVNAAYDAPVGTDIKFVWSTPATAIADKYVSAPDLGTATNIATQMTSIRRAMTTSQPVGAPGGVANGFTTYREFGVISPTADGTCTLRMAANAAGTATFRANSSLTVRRTA